MQFERKNVSSNFIIALQKHISKKGLKVSERKLTDTILEFIAKNETEVLHMIKKKRNYEAKLKKWLDTPVDAERTNALEDHDLVI